MKYVNEEMRYKAQREKLRLEITNEYLNDKLEMILKKAETAIEEAQVLGGDIFNDMEEIALIASSAINGQDK